MSITDRIKRALARVAREAKLYRETVRQRNRELALLKETRRELRRLRGRRKALREGGGDITDEQREARQEAVADEIEAQLAKRDRILERLDGLRRKGARVRARLLANRRQVRRLRRRRKRIKRQREANQGSRYFTIAEADCKDGTPVPGCAEDDLLWLYRNVADHLREDYGRGTVTSGHRHRAYNRSIGSFDGSYHEYEQRCQYTALDLRFERGTPDDWARRARQLLPSGTGGIGVYPRSGFVHIDPRPYVSDWRG